jgi:hypothetical protein
LPGQVTADILAFLEGRDKGSVFPFVFCSDMIDLLEYFGGYNIDHSMHEVSGKI